MVGRNACTKFEQTARTVAGLRTDFIHAFFRQTVSAQYRVERATQIKCGIGKRAVKVE